MTRFYFWESEFVLCYAIAVVPLLFLSDRRLTTTEFTPENIQGEPNQKMVNSMLIIGIICEESECSATFNAKVLKKAKTAFKIPLILFWRSELIDRQG